VNTAGDANGAKRVNKGWRSFGSSTPARVCLVACLVLLVAVVVVVAVVDRSSGPPRVASLGTLDASSTTVARTVAPTTARVDAQPPVTYPVATTVPAPVPPVSIAIPAIGVVSDVVGVGVVPGTDEVEVPDIEHVGWFRLGPSPGQDGSSVLLGHVDGDGRPGVFFRLGELVPGDIVTVTDAQGARDFRVTGREQVAKAALPADLFSRAGPPRLVLITCGGQFDDTTGHYVDNVVVVAVPV
jgi:Sortase domain